MNVVGGVSCIMTGLVSAEEINLVHLTQHSCTATNCPPLISSHPLEEGHIHCLSDLKVR